GRDVLHLPGGPVVLGNLVAPGAVDDVAVERVGGDVAVLDHPDRVPVARGDRAVIAAAGDAYRAALLLACADAVGEGRGDADVEVRGVRLVEQATPGITAVECHERPLVADQRHDAAVLRAHPQVLVVVAARRATPRGPAPAAIDRLHGDQSGGVH